MKNNISVLPDGYSYRKNPPLMNCDDCIIRKLATLIVSGIVMATEIQNEENKDLWNNLAKKSNIREEIYHGKEWHKKMMNVIYTYFENNDYKIKLEPILNYGRADLGIYPNSNSKNVIYVEVGTVSLYKLWYNLLTMRNIVFLIVPAEEKIIELRN